MIQRTIAIILVIFAVFTVMSSISGALILSTVVEISDTYAPAAEKSINQMDETIEFIEQEEKRLRRDAANTQREIERIQRATQREFDRLLK